MENARKKNAVRGKERSRSPLRVTIAGAVFLVTGLVVLAGCATGGNAKLEASRADCEQAIAMIMDADYDTTIELMAEWEHPVTGSTAPGGSAETAPVSPSVRSKAPMLEAVPLKTEMPKQPAVVPSRSEGNEHGTSAKQ